MTTEDPTVENVHPLFSQFEIDGDEIKLIDADYLVDTTYTAGDGIEINDNVISCTVTTEDPTIENVHPLFSSTQFEIDGDEIKLIDADYLIDTTYTSGEGIEINDNVITCTVTGGGGGGGTTYDDTTRLRYKFLTEPTQDGNAVANIDDLTFTQDLNIQEPTQELLNIDPTFTQELNIEEPTIIQDANIEEPTFTQPTYIEPTTSETPITIDSDYKYISFPYTGSGNDTSYDITFNEDTECDILIVAGGGGGGSSYMSGSSAPGAGGGAGGLIFIENQTVSSGTYTINVGKGGTDNDFNDNTVPKQGKQGNNCSFSYHVTDAVGGGGGASRGGITIGGNGGSGGGSAYDEENTNEKGIGVVGQGFDGGITLSSTSDSDNEPYASGGGGAGAEGHANDDPDDTIDGDGGIGKYIVETFNFREKFGLPSDNTLGEFFNGDVYFAGRGSCGVRSTNNSFGGKGGGSSSSTTISSLHGMVNTGGGGSGARTANEGQMNGGNGGSGIVIIRYKYTRPQIQIQDIDSDYKYISFPYTSGATDTSYDITFNENTECDILVIGGDGGGSGGHGGGGGAGQLVFINNAILNGNYNITVGKGSTVLLVVEVQSYQIVIPQLKGSIVLLVE